MARSTTPMEQVAESGPTPRRLLADLGEQKPRGAASPFPVRARAVLRCSPGRAPSRDALLARRIGESKQRIVMIVLSLRKHDQKAAYLRRQLAERNSCFRWANCEEQKSRRSFMEIAANLGLRRGSRVRVRAGVSER